MWFCEDPFILSGAVTKDHAGKVKGGFNVSALTLKDFVFRVSGQDAPS